MPPKQFQIVCLACNFASVAIDADQADQYTNLKRYPDSINQQFSCPNCGNKQGFVHDDPTRADPTKRAASFDIVEAAPAPVA